ncbi:MULTISPECIES: hypothetical protein [unclassified Microcoleus]|uniref:hypothetical protein n=1 Tax=unclassified Microcoleus TaxID=2642155 RepID=UPI001D749F66|nr:MULTISPECIES: hypothetical protein [unclassified Microcoleus]MCC3626840.1 hypothetical protein [Microcoleus sp. PH2017_36_ELK_O_B]MCC3640678.1 hypothetical protein [Microcoleus sp. PH2017_33_LGB_O_A]
MVTAQLSLFATSPAVGTLYKAGDWVKLRKKPSSAAAWVKRGEVFRIESVHPVDGSMRFWNPHINEWGFLYPDEVSLVPAPNDSVSEAIAPVEVDTESNSPNDSVSEAIAPVAPNDSVSGCKAISTYRPRGTARSGEYFRFSYRDGSRMRHIHIRGGNTDSPIAQARVEEVRSLLAAGAKSAEIVEMLRGGA